MGGQKLGFGVVSLLALVSSAKAYAQEAEPRGDEAGPAANQRSLAFTVPLVSSSRVFGDVLIELGAANEVRIEALGFRREIEPLLADTGRVALDGVLAGKAFVSPAELKQAGFDVAFDMGQLELRIQRVEPRYLRTQTLLGDGSDGNRVDLTTIQPADFSTYVNATANFDYDTRTGRRSPDFFFDGATRVGSVVLEYEGALTDQFEDGYRFYRRSTRAVYDDPDSYRRYSAGDLRLNSLSILRSPQIAGVAVEKGRQIFDPFFSVTRLGGRQIFLDNRSDVDVLVNGVRYESLQLDAGTYDLSELPIQQGANDIQLLVRDSFGRQRVIDYNFFFEPLSLPAGEEEYSLALGVVSENFEFQPEYGNNPVAAGYYRRAMSENLILGGSAQVTEDVQVLGATTTVVPQVVPGVFDLEIAGSQSDAGVGFALRSGFRYQTGGASGQSRQFSVNVDYQSSKFATIDNLVPVGFDLLSISGSYSQSIGPKTYGVIGGNYTRRGSRIGNDYGVFVDLNHRLTPRIRGTVGLEYGLETAFRSAFGVRVGITAALGTRSRASADYRSRTDSYRATYSRGADSQIGSLGYDLSIAKFGDDTQGNAQVDYIANRFEARANLTTGGRSFGEFFEDQRARLQIATSLAFADGSFGIGRPIDNSFALVQPHKALKDNGIISARSLSRSSYYARSGLLGAAVQGDLSAYSEQNVQFDAANPEDGFDVGDGVVLVDPPYKSGYRVLVGSENFVTYIGTLEDIDGPVELVTGVVEALDGDENFEALPFYTNRAGRFGIFGLAPGGSYRITLNGSGRRFTIEVPKKTGAVIRSGTIVLPGAD